MTYIGETVRTLMKRLTKHKDTVWKGDTENGTAVYAGEHHTPCDELGVIHSTG